MTLNATTLTGTWMAFCLPLEAGKHNGRQVRDWRVRFYFKTPNAQSVRLEKLAKPEADMQWSDQVAEFMLPLMNGPKPDKEPAATYQERVEAYFNGLEAQTLAYMNATDPFKREWTHLVHYGWEMSVESMSMLAADPATPVVQ